MTIASAWRWFGQNHLISAARFALIERRVGPRYHVGKTLAFGKLSDAQGHCDLDVGLFGAHRLGGDAPANPFRNDLRAVELSVGQQDQKLFAAPARHAVRRPRAIHQNFRDTDQNVIASVVAKAIIDRLEMIDIAKQNR